MRQTQTNFSLPYSPQFCRSSFLILPVLLVLLAALLAPAPLLAARPSGKRLHIPVTVIPGLTAEIQSLRFYATDYGQQDFRRRKYAKVFPASGIKYLNWEVILDHPFVRDHALRFLITAVLTGPDGKKLDTSQTLAWIEPDATWTQWGKAFRVNTWKPGTYKVALIIAKKKLYQTSFQVVQKGKAPVRTESPLAILQPRVKSLRFYAGAAKATPYYRARFATDFKRRDTRQIWWVLDLEFLGRRSGPVTVPLNETWYGPGNRVINRRSRKFTVPPHKKYWWWSARYGFNEPGKWQPGSYRVVLKSGGKTLAAGSFKVEGKGAPRLSGNFLKQHHMKFVSFKFFEGPKKTPKYGNRSYGVKFPRSTTRHIFWEFDVDVLKPATAPVPFAIKAFWYDPSGRLMIESAAHFTLEKTTKRPWYTKGYGFRTPGHWKPGKYRVVLKIKGREVAAGSFEITAGKTARPGGNFLTKHHLRLESLKFLPGTKKPPRNFSSGFQLKFPQSTTRYIWWKLSLESLGPQPVRVPFTIKTFWYGPGGRLIKEATAHFHLRKNDARPWYGQGFGYYTPGLWEPGKHRVVLKIDNKEVAAGSFEITAPRKAATTPDFLRRQQLKFVSLRFFEGPKRLPAPYRTRTYQTQFSNTSTGYLHWEILLKSKGIRTADAPFALESFLYGPDSSLMKKRTFDLMLKKTYFMPVFAGPVDGYLSPERWKPGKYRVVLKIKGQELAVGSFEITKGVKFPLKK